MTDKNKTTKKPVKKATTRKAPAKKATTKKPVAKKTVAKKPAAKRATGKPKNEKLAKAMKGNSNGSNGGRKTVYDSSLVDKLVKFFCIEESPFREVEGKGGVQLIPRRMPTIERFAVMCGVTRQTLHDWATAKKKDSEELLHPEFSYAYSRARDAQASFVIEGGVAGALQSNFSALFLKNFHGWQDKTEQEVTQTSKIDLSLVDAELADAAAERKAKIEEMKEKGKAGKFST